MVAGSPRQPRTSAPSPVVRAYDSRCIAGLGKEDANVTRFGVLLPQVVGTVRRAPTRRATQMLTSYMR